jgi:hypothetical protein
VSKNNITYNNCSVDNPEKTYCGSEVMMLKDKYLDQMSEECLSFINRRFRGTQTHNCCMLARSKKTGAGRVVSLL